MERKQPINRTDDKSVEHGVRQGSLFASASGTWRQEIEPFRTQLLKWVGNKQRFAEEIISFFPPQFRQYHEPFLGSGAVLGTLAPRTALGSDVLQPLIEIWQMLQVNPSGLLEAYRSRWNSYQRDRKGSYERIKKQFNQKANPEDLLFLSRSCYGGVIRFRRDGYMSTPIGIHKPISPASFATRISIWRERTKGATFACCDFEESMEQAGAGDVIYCDPPYSDTQAILYGAQEFTLERLFEAIGRAKMRGVYVILSIDGRKKSGTKTCHIPVPDGLFERTAFVHCGRSMLRRFQREGETLEDEVVADRLLLTW